jgi:hypothetical protein
MSSLLHHVLPAMMFCLVTGLKATGPSVNGLKYLKPWTK